MHTGVCHFSLFLIQHKSNSHGSPLFPYVFFSLPPCLVSLSIGRWAHIDNLLQSALFTPFSPFIVLPIQGRDRFPPSSRDLFCHFLCSLLFPDQVSLIHLCFFLSNWSFIKLPAKGAYLFFNLITSGPPPLPYKPPPLLFPPICL